MSDLAAILLLIGVLAGYAPVWLWAQRRQQELYAIGAVLRAQVADIRRRWADAIAADPRKRDEMNREIVAVYESRTTILGALLPTLAHIPFLAAIYSLVLFIIG